MDSPNFAISGQIWTNFFLIGQNFNLRPNILSAAMFGLAFFHKSRGFWSLKRKGSTEEGGTIHNAAQSRQIFAYDSIHDSFHNRIHDRIHDRIHGRIHDRIHDSIHETIHDRIQDRIHDKIHDRIHERIHDRIHDSIHVMMS